MLDLSREVFFWAFGYLSLSLGVEGRTMTMIMFLWEMKWINVMVGYLSFSNTKYTRCAMLCYAML
jgi:hypothetical protein